MVYKTPGEIDLMDEANRIVHRVLAGIGEHIGPGMTTRELDIYAEATILGTVTIGRRSEIGGNVWLTHSVPPGSKVYNQQPRPLVRRGDGSWILADRPWADFGAGI